MMAVGLLLTLFGLPALANWAIVRMYQRRQASTRYWVALMAAWMAGAILGIWTGFFFEYQPRPGVRIVGAPVYAAILRLEGPPGDQRWTDYVTPMPLLFAASNIVLLAMVAAIPVGCVGWLVAKPTRH